MEATVNFTTTVAVSNLPADPSTGAKQDAQTTALGGLATQTTLAAVLAKLVAAPALDATVAAGNTLLSQIKALLPAGLVGGRLDVNIGASGATVPVSLAGVATETTAAAILAKQPAAPALESGHLATIDTSTTTLATNLPAKGQALAAASMPVVLPAIQVASMATSAAQTTAQTSLTSIDGKTPSLGQALAVGAVPVVLTAIQVAALAQDRTTAASPSAVRQSDGSAFIAPALEGGHLATIDTSTAAGAASLVSILAKLIAAPATAALQGGGLPSALVSNRLDVNIGASGATVPTSSALGSTSALQSTGNTSIASIDTKTPALGQALAAASVPVVLTALQVAQLAQDASILARCLLGQGVTSAARTVVGPSDASIRFIEGAPSGGAWTDLTPTTALNAGSTSVQLIAAATNRRLRLLRPTLNVHTAAVNVAVFNGAGTWGTSTNLIDYFPVAASSLANNRDYTGDGVTCASGVFVLISTGLFTAAIAAPPAGVVFNGLYV